MCVLLTYLGFGKGDQHVVPPLGLLRARSLDEGDPLRGGDGDRVRMAGDGVGRAYLQHLRHIDYGLRYRFGLFREGGKEQKEKGC